MKGGLTDSSVSLQPCFLCYRKPERIVPTPIPGQNITSFLENLQIANMVYVPLAKADVLDGNAFKYAGHIDHRVDCFWRE